MPAVHKQKKRGSVGHEPQKRLWGRQIPIQGLMGTRAVCHEFGCPQNTMWAEFDIYQQRASRERGRCGVCVTRVSMCTKSGHPSKNRVNIVELCLSLCCVRALSTHARQSAQCDCNSSDRRPIRACRARERLPPMLFHRVLKAKKAEPGRRSGSSKPIRCGHVHFESK